MDELALNIYNLCVTAQPYSKVLLILAALVIGVMFIIPSEKSHELGKKLAPWCLLGALLILGAVHIGEWIFGQIVFSVGTAPVTGAAAAATKAPK